MTEVLYISYDGMTDPLGRSQVIPYLIGLSKQGYHFTILSAEKRANYEEKKKETGEWLQKNNIDWKPVFYTKYPPVLSTLIDVRNLRRHAFLLQKTKKFAIVHCRSYIASLIGLEMKKKFGLKFIFDIRGLWADERVDGGLWNLKNPVYHSIYKFFKKKEIEFFENADSTICLTENGKNEILSWPPFKNNPIPITVIPCCVDLTLFDPEKTSAEQKRTLRNELAISENSFVLGYLGSLGTWYLPHEMLDFFFVLQKKIPNSVFLFISNVEKKEILKMAEAYPNLSGKIIVRKVQHEEVPGLLSLCNFMIIFIKNVYSKKASSPTKLGEALAMNIPVICNSGVGDINHLFEKYPVGFKLENLTGAEFEKVVDQLMIENSFPGLRTVAENVFSLQKGIDDYKKIYQSVSN